MAGEQANAWQRGRSLSITSGPRRAALTLMVGSERDVVEMEVLDGTTAPGLPHVKDKVLGAWTGPAASLLLPTSSKKEVGDEPVIRVEGEVRLAHTCSRMITYAHVCSHMLTYADV